MAETEAQSWNFLAIGYPVALVFGAVVVLQLGAVQAAIVVVAGTLLVWLKQPLGVACREGTVLFRILPLWVQGIEVPADALVILVKRGGITFRPRDRRRLPVFRKLSWHRDLIDPGLPKFLAALRSAGCWVDEDE